MCAISTALENRQMKKALQLNEVLASWKKKMGANRPKKKKVSVNRGNALILLAVNDVRYIFNTNRLFFTISNSNVRSHLAFEYGSLYSHSGKLTFRSYIAIKRFTN